MAQEDLLKNKIIKILLAESIIFKKIKNHFIAYHACIYGLKDGTNSDVQASS
jgi:hypothetical protein